MEPPAAQSPPHLVHVVQHTVGATPADHVIGRIPGDPFGALVPVGDAALLVDEVHPVVEVIQDPSVESRLPVHTALRRLA